MERKNIDKKMSKDLPTVQMMRECLPGSVPGKKVKKLMREEREEKKRQEARGTDGPIVPKLVGSQDKRMQN